jgi:hypothetical protein
MNHFISIITSDHAILYYCYFILGVIVGITAGLWASSNHGKTNSYR